MDARPYWLEGLASVLKKEATQWSQILPTLPRLIHDTLSRSDMTLLLLIEMSRLRRAREQGNRLMAALIGLIAVAAISAFWIWKN